MNSKTSLKPSKDYIDCIASFDNTIQHCIDISQKYAGISSPTGTHFYASVLFTSLCTRGISLAILAPQSRWSIKIIDHWDYASIAVMTRSILEIRLAFFYLCVDPCTAEQWESRWNIFNLHDCTARTRLFEEMQSEPTTINDFNIQADELRNRLSSNSFFMRLPEKDKKKYLHGNHAYLYSLEEIAAKADIDVPSFRLLYKLLSSHVHGLPLAFYRMGTQERGRGVHSEVEEGYTKMFLEFSIDLLTAASNEMESLFSKTNII